eukprot:754931-Hanusia_phi.AAC.1
MARSPQLSSGSSSCSIHSYAAVGSPPRHPRVPLAVTQLTRTCESVTAHARQGDGGRDVREEIRDLGREEKARKRVVPHQVDPIAKGTGGRKRPAGAAVGRDVLVPVGRCVVHPREVSDVPSARELQRRDVLHRHLPHSLIPFLPDQTRMLVAV